MLFAHKFQAAILYNTQLIDRPSEMWLTELFQGFSIYCSYLLKQDPLRAKLAFITLSD